jgi:hypothetical protein
MASTLLVPIVLDERSLCPKLRSNPMSVNSTSAALVILWEKFNKGNSMAQIIRLFYPTLPVKISKLAQ